MIKWTVVWAMRMWIVICGCDANVTCKGAEKEKECNSVNNYSMPVYYVCVKALRCFPGVGELRHIRLCGHLMLPHHPVPKAMCASMGGLSGEGVVSIDQLSSWPLFQSLQPACLGWQWKKGLCLCPYTLGINLSVGHVYYSASLKPRAGLGAHHPPLPKF